MSPRTREFNQDKVIEKAIELFCEKGYAGTSMRDLISHLEISSSSLYNTFGGKDELFLIALKRHSQHELKLFRKALESEEDPKQILLEMFENLIDTLMENKLPGGSLTLKASVELENQKPEVAAIVSEHSLEANQILTDFLTKAAERGQINLRRSAYDIASYIQFNIFNMNFIAKVNRDRKCLMNYATLVLSILE